MEAAEAKVEAAKHEVGAAEAKVEAAKHEVEAAKSECRAATDADEKEMLCRDWDTARGGLRTAQDGLRTAQKGLGDVLAFAKSQRDRLVQLQQASDNGTLSRHFEHPLTGCRPGNGVHGPLVSSCCACWSCCALLFTVLRCWWPTPAVVLHVWLECRWCVRWHAKRLQFVCEVSAMRWLLFTRYCPCVLLHVRCGTAFYAPATTYCTSSCCGLRASGDCTLLLHAWVTGVVVIDPTVAATAAAAVVGARVCDVPPVLAHSTVLVCRCRCCLPRVDQTRVVLGTVERQRETQSTHSCVLWTRECIDCVRLITLPVCVCIVFDCCCPAAVCSVTCARRCVSRGPSMLFQVPTDGTAGAAAAAIAAAAGMAVKEVNSCASSCV